VNPVQVLPARPGLWPGRLVWKSGLQGAGTFRRGKPAELPVVEKAAQSSTGSLALLALGVVYGDIGTSPLYAVRETFNPDHGLALTVDNILGGLSAIFWILTIVVSLKYVMLMLRADNQGEGGIMALCALAKASLREHPGWTPPLLALAVLGASLFYGDAVLTPAISVLSAVEGLEVGTLALKPYIVPLATGMLLALFLMQARGTRSIGLLFGPVCALWFIAIGASGFWNVAANPSILQALDPHYALRFVTSHGVTSFLVLGSVLLAVTGAEALYADMGHLGKRPIRFAWFGLVAPALVLNYFGQGAVLMTSPEAVVNPFYLAFPAWALYPMVALATAATIIASQATISGAYSTTCQAIQLGYLPRMNIRHTCARTIGQIYIPVVNWVLFAAVFIVVVEFGSSSALASAYGVAVMGTMLATTCLAFFLMRYGWGYPLWLSLGIAGALTAIEATLFASALFKIGEGGWFPLLIAAAVFILMTTWRKGRELTAARLHDSAVPLEIMLKTLVGDPRPRVPGTAVFLTSTRHGTPQSLLHNLKHNHVLHARIVFLHVELRDRPYVPDEARVVREQLGAGCWRVCARFGFMERPDVTKALCACACAGLALDLARTTFFVSHTTIVPMAARSGMTLWRKRLFALMTRVAGDTVRYFNLPAERVVELGVRVEI
jgi:KUP system potassium uptake protein